MPTGTAAAPDAPILVVDDDAKIVALLRLYLEREGFRVVAAATGEEALERFRDSGPAAIVLDLMLPGLDGLSVCRRVRLDSDVPILMLSARGSVADRIRGLEDGADDYLPKPFSPAEAVVRVRAMLRRRSAGVDERVDRVLTHGDLSADLDRHEVRVGDRLVSLTAVEFRLLAALLGAGGRVLTRDQLLDAVYGRDQVDVMDRTIDVHVGRLREKLGDDPDRPRFIATVRGTGYRAAPVAPARPPVESA